MDTPKPYRLRAPWANFNDRVGLVAFEASVSEPVDEATARRIEATMGFLVEPVDAEPGPAETVPTPGAPVDYGTLPAEHNPATMPVTTTPDTADPPVFEGVPENVTFDPTTPMPPNDPIEQPPTAPVANPVV